MCLLLEGLGFLSAWNTYSGIHLIPKHLLCKEEKYVYAKRAKEQHLFKPQHLLVFSASLFLLLQEKNPITYSFSR